MWAVKSYIYQLFIEYGFYVLILFAGSGFYLWRRLKSWFDASDGRIALRSNPADLPDYEGETNPLTANPFEFAPIKLFSVPS